VLGCASVLSSEPIIAPHGAANPQFMRGLGGRGGGQNTRMVRRDRIGFPAVGLVDNRLLAVV